MEFKNLALEKQPKPFATGCLFLGVMVLNPSLDDFEETLRGLQLKPRAVATFFEFAVFKVGEEGLELLRDHIIPRLLVGNEVETMLANIGI